MQKITTFLWFDDNAEEAANLYVSIFKNSKVRSVTRYGEAGAGVSGRKAGSAMTVSFVLDGQEFTALNGGPQFRFTPAISLVVNCASQKEVDEVWGKLCDGGEEGQCGWLTDKFGVSWQVVPAGLGKIIQGKDPKRSEAAMKAMFQMKKLDIEALQRAYDA
jgi:predicted 3-demethylubiquinone-9 3-methyltransferase (glyoxalase superfamily)